MLFFWFWLLILCKLINCSESEVLMGLWRDYEDEYTSVLKELEIVEAQILAEKNFIVHYEKVSKAVTDLNKSFEIDPNDKIVWNLDSLNHFKKTSISAYNYEIRELLKRESGLENACQDEDFWSAVEFVINKSVLTPQPGVPIVDADNIKELMRREETIFDIIGQEEIRMSHNLRKISKCIRNLEGTLMEMNKYVAFNFALNTIKVSSPTEISDIVEEFQKNQKLKIKYEMDINVMRNDNEMKVKFEEDMRNGEGQWSIRLGGFQVKSDSPLKSDDLIHPNVMAAVKRAASSTKILSEPHKLADKLTEFYSQFRSNPILNQFVIHKYLKYLESVYDYLLKKRGKPLSLYGEAVELIKIN